MQARERISKADSCRKIYNRLRDGCLSIVELTMVMLIIGVNVAEREAKPKAEAASGGAMVSVVITNCPL